MNVFAAAASGRAVLAERHLDIAGHGTTQGTTMATKFMPYYGFPIDTRQSIPRA